MKWSQKISTSILVRSHRRLVRLCRLHDGFNGAFGLRLSHVLAQGVAQDGQLPVGLRRRLVFWTASMPAAAQRGAISPLRQAGIRRRYPSRARAAGLASNPGPRPVRRLGRGRSPHALTGPADAVLMPKVGDTLIRPCR